MESHLQQQQDYQNIWVCINREHINVTSVRTILLEATHSGDTNESIQQKQESLDATSAITSLKTKVIYNATKRITQI